ncbi:uncharacterized protein LOC131071698 isoform X2 [Cryptomeria japonica]|uniref:uncharacterized protein LOC131071698 isoform X2 n=1 Tax=Cryptomeria japonica TaxID=3369 RepID=UPI0025AD42F3|nr:uncharacterized protein LOC131071698 isoform X2 [Cryptomeria japonica]
MESRRKLCSIQGASECLMASPSEIGSNKKSAEWILEYIIRHCNEDWIISGLIRALPISNENFKLKKMMLLKSISSDLSKGIISEKTLETLQSFKDLNRQIYRDSNSEKLIQELCCKVAVECTVKFLRGTCKINWDGYNDALCKLWTYRAEDTEDVEMDGAFIDVKKELLAVASNPKLRERLLEKYKQDDVFKCLDAFLKDSWEEMGPSFLEIVAEDVVQGRYNPIAGQDSNRGVITARMAVPSCEAGGLACRVPDNNEEITSTFPPPWAGPDMSKDKKNTACNLKENQAISSKTREASNSSGQPLSDRTFSDHEPISINLEKTQIPRQDDPVRKEATAAQERGKESVPDLDDVNAHKRPRLGTDNISNSKQLLTPDGKFPDCQPIINNLEKTQILSQDDPVRKEATAAQERGKESVPDLDDVNACKRPRLGTVNISNYKQLLTPEYVRVKEDLRRSTSELHALVEDPLPNAVQVAESCAAREEGFRSAVHLDGKRQLEKQINEVEKTILPENNTGLDNEAQHLEEKENRNQSGKSGGGPVKVNIMDRNPTARTFEWDEQDTIDSEQDKSPSASRKLRLPTPVRKHVSPLKRSHTSAYISFRRKPTKWSLVEEETLKKEVAKYGKRWKYILENNRDIFEERTEVDLKDKWRNIERRDGLHAS